MRNLKTFKKINKEIKKLSSIEKINYLKKLLLSSDVEMNFYYIGVVFLFVKAFKELEFQGLKEFILTECNTKLSIIIFLFLPLVGIDKKLMEDISQNSMNLALYDIYTGYCQSFHFKGEYKGDIKNATLMKHNLRTFPKIYYSYLDIRVDDEKFLEAEMYRHFHDEFYFSKEIGFEVYRFLIGHRRNLFTK